MRKTIYLLLFTLLADSIWGQTTFHKRYSFSNYAFGLTPLNNGQFLLTGNFYSTADYTSLLRLDQSGSPAWATRYTYFSLISQVAEAENGWVVVGDSTQTNGANPFRNAIVMRTDAAGKPLWARMLGNQTLRTLASQVLKVPGGYVLSGRDFRNHSQVDTTFLCKFSEDGELLWSKNYYANLPNHFNHFKPKLVQEDTLFACGMIQGNAAFIRLHLNTGEVLGLSSFGGLYHEDINSMIPTPDSNFVLAGTTRSTTDSEYDIPWLIKMNRYGQIIWSKTYKPYNATFTASIDLAEDGNMVLALNTTLAKINAAGEVLWAYDYSGGQIAPRFQRVFRSSDGGFVAQGGSVVLKTDINGRVSNGCCPEPVSLEVEDFLPPFQNPPMVAAGWIDATVIPLPQRINDSANQMQYCQTSVTSISQQIEVCQGDSVEINGQLYDAPNIVRDTLYNFDGGCDTVRVYNLVEIPQPFKISTFLFCPGTAVVVNGITYTQPDTFTQILPAAQGCDTLALYHLRWKPLPQKYEIITFCPGDTVFVNGNAYFSPGALPQPDTLTGPPNACDTLLFQVLSYPYVAAQVSLQCPPDLTLITDAGAMAVVNYPTPDASTTCNECTQVESNLAAGLPSGAAFPPGITQVCYLAYDNCGNSGSCCFNVNVEELEACDVKEDACIRYELLDIRKDINQNKTYRVRIRNKCASAAGQVLLQIPEGANALAPLPGSLYTTVSGENYAVRNPHFSPFRSLRFKAEGAGIGQGQSDIFDYTLPAQSSPTFLRAGVRLASGAFYETTLNTFGCNTVQRPTERSTISPAASAQIFPNPSEGVVLVSVPGMWQRSVRCTLRTVDGLEIAIFSLPAGETSPLSIPEDLPGGLYFLTLQPEAGAGQTLRFVLQR